jgi:hypothetical protein
MAALTLGLSAVAGAAPVGEAVRLRLTVVFDNVGGRSGLTPAWGFACLVEAAGTALLFDTGADGAVLLANLQRLGQRADELDAVVPSHIHADHTGGLAAVLDARRGVAVWLPASFPDTFQRESSRRGARLHAVHVGGPPFGPFASTGPLDHGLTEQALIVDTARGLVVVTGCAHRGDGDAGDRAADPPADRGLASAACRRRAGRAGDLAPTGAGRGACLAEPLHRRCRDRALTPGLRRSVRRRRARRRDRGAAQVKLEILGAESRGRGFAAACSQLMRLAMPAHKVSRASSAWTIVPAAMPHRKCAV